MPSTAPPIEEIVPHRGTMLLIERVISWDEHRVTVAATPRASAWYADPRDMPSWIGIELMAQTVAAHVGLIARSAGEPPKMGLLLGTRAYRATRDRFPAGLELRVTTELGYRETSGFASYEGAISLGDAVVATARLSLFQPPDFGAFLAQWSA